MPIDSEAQAPRKTLSHIPPAAGTGMGSSGAVSPNQVGIFKRFFSILGPGLITAIGLIITWSH